MKRKTSSALSVLLTAALLLGLLPVAALAADPVFTGNISKTITVPGILTLEEDDFSDLYTKNDGDELASIVITDASSDFGALELDGDTYVLGTAVTLSELGDGKLTFTADEEGSVTFAVKAYPEDSDESLGDVSLTITAEEEDTKDITYETEQDTPVSFRASSFAAVSKDKTGDELDYVEFTLPSEDDGILYYLYDSEDEYGDTVSEDTEYYRSTVPCISSVDFVPASGYTGTVIVDYAAVTVNGLTYTGKVYIDVNAVQEDDGDDEDSTHFNDVGRGHRWAVGAIDYLYEHGIVQGSGNGYYNPNASLSRGDFVLMLCRAFDLNADSQGNFADVDEDSYYSGAVATAKALKIAKGQGGKFNPNASLSRQDAMVLLVRAMEAAGIDLDEADESVLDGFTDSNKISDYALSAVAALVNTGIIEGNGGKLSPKASVSRAEMAVILYRAMTM